MCSDRNSRCSPAGAGPSKNRASPIGALLREARERRPALPVGAQERRSSDRHRGRRERWPLLPEGQFEVCFGRLRHENRWGRTTGVQETLGSPPGEGPGAPVSDRHRGRRPRNSRSRPRSLRGPGRGRCHATKRPPRRGAKLPSPVPRSWERWPVLPVGVQERRSSDRHRGRRPRNSRSRPRLLRGTLGATSPVPGPVGTSRWGSRSAGLQTGIAAVGRETPALVHAHCVDPGGDGATQPNGLPAGERNSRRQSLPGAETLGTLASPPGGGPGAPVFRPASRP